MTFSRIGLKLHENNRQAARSLAWESDWILHELCYPDKIAKPWARIWLTQDKQTSIQYIENSFEEPFLEEALIYINYFIVEGKDKEEIFKYICDSLDVFDLGVIKQILQNEPSSEEDNQEYLDAIYNMGIIATPGKFDGELFALFEKVLSHASPEIRHAGILATYLTNWREFIEPLERIKNTDPDPDIRELAELALYNFSQLNWDEIEQA